MTKKEVLDYLISKVAEDQKEAFVAELREAKTREDRMKVAEKYKVVLSEEDKKEIEANKNKLSDEQLDQAAGGCQACSCSCSCD